MGKIKDSFSDKFNISEKVWSILEILMCCLIALAAAYLIVTFVGQRTVVDGDSMYNTLSDGDNIIVEKLSYTFGDVERYDIIVFTHYEPAIDEEVYYIKRVIGMPGDTIQIEDGVIYLINENGDRETMPDNYGYYYDGNIMKSGIAANPIEIPEGYYFVLGDNRNNSKDSRSSEVGLVSEDAILGKAWLRFYPLEDFGLINHR